MAASEYFERMYQLTMKTYVLYIFHHFFDLIILRR